jgi:hypothetical protein
MHRTEKVPLGPLSSNEKIVHFWSALNLTIIFHEFTSCAGVWHRQPRFMKSKESILKCSTAVERSHRLSPLLAKSPVQHGIPLLWDFEVRHHKKQLRSLHPSSRFNHGIINRRWALT